MRFFKGIFVVTVFSTLILSNNLIINPLIFIYHSTGGNDWMYKNKPVTFFGTGIGAYYKNDKWSINTEYLQLGMLGNIGKDIFDFSPRQSLPYIDESKDAAGYWSEYATTKIKYISNNFEINFGKFDRHWGSGKRALHISSKVPSYPQIGFDWSITKNIKLIYFHGFLNSGISDTNRFSYYKNNYSERSINIPRNIAAHRIEWRPSEKIILSANESVIYATRSLDFHYLIPIIPFYPIENYLGDTDNIQMGCDILFLPYSGHKFYLGFFMDELTPEWIFNSKNHNWFAWQFGYIARNIFFDDETIVLEYNWTDQRIYKHKYNVNDFYSHMQTLGFWAGPHAQEFLIDYFLQLRKNKLIIEYSNVKRGIVTEEMVQENYEDNQKNRFQSGYELKSLLSVFFSRSSRIESLDYSIGLKYLMFKNVGFSILEVDYMGVNIEKLSMEFRMSYNFKM